MLVARLLREAWGKAVEEVLLNDVVERFRRSIETKKVRQLHDISKEDCDAVERGMTECSRWIRGHDESSADGTPFPKPADLSKEHSGARRLDTANPKAARGEEVRMM
jgi:hypothetical protein